MRAVCLPPSGVCAEHTGPDEAGGQRMGVRSAARGQGTGPGGWGGYGGSLRPCLEFTGNDFDAVSETAGGMPHVSPMATSAFS